MKLRKSRGMSGLSPAVEIISKARTHHLRSPAVLAGVAFSLLSMPFATGQVTAVEFGGNYNDGADNADKSGYTLENGDFDGEGDSADRRGYIPFGTLFRNINDANGVGNNNVIYHGTQHTHLDDTATDPSIGIFRFENSAVDDRLQCGHGGTTAVTQQTFAPHVVKADFLNGAATAPNLFFEDAAGSVTVSLANKSGAGTVNRALVKNGSSWYVSSTASSSTALLSINGFTEMWIPYDPDTNIYLSATVLAGTAVAGSTFNDIQAFGAVVQQNNIASGRAVNDDRFSVNGFSARMTDTLPQILVVNQDSRAVPNGGLPALEKLDIAPYTISFDAGATADKLIVALSSETGGSGPATISYDGVPLTFVAGTQNNKTKGIWYLDNPSTGGAADLVIDMTSYDVVNGIGFGVVSISGSAPGVSGGAAAGGVEVSVPNPDAGSFVMSAYSSNTTGAITVPTGHGEVYSSTNIGSAAGAAAYRSNAAAGTQTVTYAQAGTPDNHSTAAAVFLPLPPITVVNSDSDVVPDTGGEEDLENNPYSFFFDAGAGADKLIVSLSSETGGAGPASISFDGVPLTFVAGTEDGKTRGIWYLDSPFTGGDAELVIDMTGYDVVNGIGFGVVSISGSAPGVSGGTAAGGLEATISNPDDGSFVMSAYTSNGNSGITVPTGHTEVYSSPAIGSASAASAYRNNAAAGIQTVTYAQTGASSHSTAAAVFLPVSDGNSFADWIAGFPGVGAQDGLDQDPDGDGIDSGVENIFGTAPDEFSAGIAVGAVDSGSNTFTFTHPQSATPADDLTASYRWSTNLVDWYDGDNADGPGGGLTVGIVAGPVGPPTTTVTATASQAVTSLFIRVEVNQD